MALRKIYTDFEKFKLKVAKTIIKIGNAIISVACEHDYSLNIFFAISKVTNTIAPLEKLGAFGERGECFAPHLFT